MYSTEMYHHSPLLERGSDTTEKNACMFFLHTLYAYICIPLCVLIKGFHVSFPNDLSFAWHDAGRNVACTQQSLVEGYNPQGYHSKDKRVNPLVLPRCLLYGIDYLRNISHMEGTMIQSGARPVCTVLHTIRCTVPWCRTSQYSYGR